MLTLSLEENEYFLDGGAYIGDTIMDFVEHTKGNFGAVYTFEFEEENYRLLCKNINEMEESVGKRIEPYCCGIWDRKEIGCCEHRGESDGTQIVSDSEKSNNSQSCQLDKLDSVLENKKVTIFKLDIEGAEIHGLRGAEKIIKEQSPKLALCLYHRPEDMWEIPLMIEEMNPGYNFGVKHHSGQNYTDTVIYGQKI